MDVAHLAKLAACPAGSKKEKKASLSVLFALINAFRQKKGDKAEGFGRGFGTGLGTDLGASVGGTVGILGTRHPIGGLVGLLGGGYLGSKGAQKLMGPASYAKNNAPTGKQASDVQVLAKIAAYTTQED